MSIEEGTPAPETGKPNVADLMATKEASIAEKMGRLRAFNEQAVLSVEGEVRRGVIAINGAGLLAVISLLKDELDPLPLRIAVALYTLGMSAGFIAWFSHLESAKAMGRLLFGLEQFFDKMRHEPLMKQPSDPEQLDRVETAFGQALEKAVRTAQTPGNRVPIWTYAGAVPFFLATALLIGDFELAPISTEVLGAHGRAASRSPRPHWAPPPASPYVTGDQSTPKH